MTGHATGVSRVPGGLVRARSLRLDNCTAEPANCRRLQTERTGVCRRDSFLRVAVLAIPALVMAQKVSYDYNKSANFTAFKTYALKDGTKVGQQLIDDRIVAAIDTELAAKGLTKSEANPDVFVVYHVAFDKQKDISTYSSGYGGGYGAYGWGWGGGLGGGRRTRRCATS